MHTDLWSREPRKESETEFNEKTRIDCIDQVQGMARQAY